MARKKKDEVIEAVIIEEKPKRKVEKEEKDEVVIEEVNNSTNYQKTYFFPRLVAYIIDIMLFSIVCTGILFVLPENKNYSKYMKEYEQIQTDYIEEKIDADEYLNKSVRVVYDIDYSNIMSMIIEVVLIILYFIVFQFYSCVCPLASSKLKVHIPSFISAQSFSPCFLIISDAIKSPSPLPSFPKEFAARKPREKSFFESASIKALFETEKRHFSPQLSALQTI